MNNELTSTDKTGWKLSYSDRLRYQRIEGWVSVAANLILFVVKYWAGTVTGSLAIVADAWHTLSDSVSSVGVVLSARLSSKPPDSNHPFGHGRIELIVSLFIAAMLFIVAYSFISDAWSKFTDRQTTEYGTLAIIVTTVSVVAKEALARYAYTLARKTGSEVLKADGWHHRSDAVSSLIILAGIFSGGFFWWIDSLLAVIVAVLIGFAAWKIVLSTVNALLGEPLPKEKIDSIRIIGKEICGRATDFHHFHHHNYISHSEVTFHMRLPGDLTISEGHELADKIEKAIRDRMGIEATIHMEPIKG
ncbi:MAG: cation transporter [Bacteroidetes bacterium]|nr:cation transporter [Bacteroidota bacterium]